jgi:copper homeostasis protein
MLLEIACFNTESAVLAQDAGADRIELCDNYFLGGITPPVDMIKTTREKISIGLFVMIRPKAGTFNYSDDEFLKMKEQIQRCKELKCDGLVFGMLDSENKVDTDRCKELVQLASPLPCTFHRAFDEVADPLKALEDIIACGFKRILTSGQKSSALQGIALIAELHQKAKGRIIILPGGGVRSQNIADLKQQIKALEFHSSAITGNDIIVDPEEVKNLKQNLMANA